jgi:hypothetical protein
VHERSLACSGGTCNERDFSGARLKIDPKQNRGGAVSRVDARKARENSAVEKVLLWSIRTGHD